MTFLELAQKRQSIRAFRSEPVEEAKLLKILEAGGIAPSAVNFQPWRFIVLQDSQMSVLKNVYTRDWFLAAPAAIVVCIDKEEAWVRKDGKSFGDIDAAIAMDHMIMAATELGLGTCWIGAFDEAAAAVALKLPENVMPVVMTPVGYPAQTPSPKPRKPLEDIVRWGSY